LWASFGALGTLVDPGVDGPGRRALRAEAERRLLADPGATAGFSRGLSSAAGLDEPRHAVPFVADVQLAALVDLEARTQFSAFDGHD